MGIYRIASDKQKLQIFPQSVGHIIWTTSNYYLSINIMYCMYVHESMTMNKVDRLGGAYCMHEQLWAE